MTPKRYQKIIEVLNQRQSDLTLVLDEVHKGRNLSAIVRSADASSIDQLHSVNSTVGFQNYKGTALGSHQWVDVISHDSVTRPINTLQKKGFQIVAAHLGLLPVDYRDIDYCKPTAIILGTEKQGVSADAMSLVDHQVTIPMKGMVASLNVSVACGILLAEIQRQRKANSHYQHMGLSDELYQYRLFHWCQPQLAVFCDERGLSYPALNNEGEVIDGPKWYKDIRIKAEIENKKTRRLGEDNLGKGSVNKG